MDFGIWFLLAAAMVFFMQCGFAMVTSGFTRAKSTANMIMKNLMDFSMGTLCFVTIGYGIMCSENYVSGLIGIPDFGIFTDYANFDFSDFVFNLVFCATAATIVAGAMAERTKFSAYLMYTAVITALVYPVQAGWVWNEEGWLAQMGFIDFAGSAAIHMVGGIAAFIGAMLLGARIGKYTKDKETGKTKVHAIPGHSLTLGALGCFILWFGWYGFNGAAAENVPQLGSIFLTTTAAASAGAIATMAFTWLKNGKPDVSMSLNGALGGLVGITAGCSYVDAFGALAIGLVAGILVVLAVEFIDMVCHVDDPVGAVAVHGVCGVWGTLAVGLFARPLEVVVEIAEAVLGESGEVVTEAVTEIAVISDQTGLLYGGGVDLLVIQATGIVAIAAWTMVTMGIAFSVIKYTVGLRVPAEEELIGLDVAEHGMIGGSYADFMTMADASQMLGAMSTKTAPAVPVAPEVAVPVTDASTGKKLTKVTIIANQSKFAALKEALDQIEITGLTLTNVLGYGVQRGHTHTYRGVPLEYPLKPKMQIDIIISKVPVETLVDAVRKVLYTGNIGDGKIFIYDVENVIRVRTGETGYDALQDER